MPIKIIFIHDRVIPQSDALQLSTELIFRPPNGQLWLRFLRISFDVLRLFLCFILCINLCMCVEIFLNFRTASRLFKSFWTLLWLYYSFGFFSSSFSERCSWRSSFLVVVVVFCKLSWILVWFFVFNCGLIHRSWRFLRDSIELWRISLNCFVKYWPFLTIMRC